MKQIYRTGVFWCFWLTVLTIVIPFFLYYAFNFKFIYLWFFFFILFARYVYSQVTKANYINSWKLSYYFKYCLTLLFKFK
jgi:hypothetical protein